LDEVVLITTDDLPAAGALRNAFERAELDVELLTPGETAADAVGDPVLVVVTGGAREAAESGRLRSLNGAGIPALGLFRPEESPGTGCRTLGYADCFTKPADIDEVVLVGRRMISLQRLRQITGIVGETEAIEEALERVVQIAGVGSTVLIQGESGTGKELVARGIHALSSRRHRPFIAVNVAALPETLLESELFGHEKGAFTGASSLRKGFFELADSGTIFLDELGEMPAATQTKLLRVLETREFRRVGGEETIRVNVRVLAATNRSLRQEVVEGNFRRDLYHRLNVLRIDMPPLRERKEDIPLLVERFVREVSEEHGRPFPGIDQAAMRILVEYEWPGNVRELRNLVESMVVLSPGRPIRPEDIPPEVRHPGGSRSLLPVHVPRPKPPESRPEEGRPAPELEFVFRTLVELKMDVEDLRKEFEAYRGEDEQSYLAVPAFPGVPADEEEAEEVTPRARGEVVYRPGMTMEEMEKRAIEAALHEVAGNRRRAAEMLGIGERTLYRKIKEYELTE